MPANDKKYYDRRTNERYVKKGILTQKDLDAHLKALPDDETAASFVQMDVHDTEASDGSDSEGTH